MRNYFRNFSFLCKCNTRLVLFGMQKIWNYYMKNNNINCDKICRGLTPHSFHKYTGVDKI